MTILPNEIPEDASPLTEVPLVPPIDRLGSVLIEGENVFVSLLTGKTLVGGCHWVDPEKLTIGLSEPILRSIVETARIV